MNKFYNAVLLVMSWLFLASAVVILFVFLSMNNGEMSEAWPMCVGGMFSSLFFAALGWVALKTSKYIAAKNEASENVEED